MINKRAIVLTSTLLMILAGCGEGIDSDSDLAQHSNNRDRVEDIFSADLDEDPVRISNAARLGAEIDRIFGGAITEPVSVNLGDTIDDVLDRAEDD